MRWCWFGLLIASLLMTACGDIDKNSTEVSLQARPATVVQGANQNLNSSSGIPVDPTKSLTQAAGATATPLPPTPTPLPVTPTPVPAATTAPPAGQTTAAAGGTTAASGGGNAANGQKLFTTNCQACHPSGGRVAGVGPKLLGTTRDDAYIQSNIRNGRNAMPAFSPDQISDQQIQDLIAYIRSLK
jgi:mono/diheme cytochrome c family protein